MSATRYTMVRQSAETKNLVLLHQPDLSTLCTVRLDIGQFNRRRINNFQYKLRQNAAAAVDVIADGNDFESDQPAAIQPIRIISLWAEEPRRRLLRM